MRQTEQFRMSATLNDGIGTSYLLLHCTGTSLLLPQLFLLLLLQLFILLLPQLYIFLLLLLQLFILLLPQLFTSTTDVTTLSTSSSTTAPVSPPTSSSPAPPGARLSERQTSNHILRVKYVRVPLQNICLHS